MGFVGQIELRSCISSSQDSSESITFNQASSGTAKYLKEPHKSDRCRCLCILNREQPAWIICRTRCHRTYRAPTFRSLTSRTHLSSYPNSAHRHSSQLPPFPVCA